MSGNLVQQVAAIVPPLNTVPLAADTSIDNDIASFLAEGNDAAADAEAAENPTATAPAEVDDDPGDDYQIPADLLEGQDQPETDNESTDETQSDETTTVAPDFDVKAISAAIEAEDPVAFVKALGKSADKLLSGKGHKALRLQVKQIEDLKAHAVEVTTKLDKKYGDPIAARKACEKGDVNAFIDMVEKWSGHDWNSVQRWVANGMAGRKSYLEVKQQEAEKAKQPELEAVAKQENAVTETKTWITNSVKKADEKLLTGCPQVVDMIFDEIKTNFSKGIDTPAKALPAVKAKLKAQYDALHDIFGGAQRPTPKTKTSTPSPAAKAGKTEGKSTRPLTLEEEIASFMKENGFKRTVGKGV